MAAKRKKPVKDVTVERELAAHVKASAERALARTGPMPDPETALAEFRAWLQKYAMPDSDAVEHPDFKALQALLKKSARLRYWRPSREGRVWNWIAYLLMCESFRGRDLKTGEVTDGMRYSVRHSILGGAPGASEAPIAEALAYFTATVRVIDATVTESELFWAIRRWREFRRDVEIV